MLHKRFKLGSRGRQIADLQSYTEEYANFIVLKNNVTVLQLVLLYDVFQ